MSSNGAVNSPRPTTSVPRQFFVVGGFLTTVLFFVSMKNIYETQAIDASGTLRPCHTPFFLFFLDFLMNAPLLILVLWESGPANRPTGFSYFSADIISASTSIVFPMVVLQVINEVVYKTSVILIAATMYLTIRTLRIPFTALVRIQYLKQEYTTLQLSSLLGIAIFASITTLIGTAYLVTPQHVAPDEKSPDDSMMMKLLPGLLLAVLSSGLSSFRSVLEESQIRAQNILPVMCSGLQGVYLSVVAALLLVIVHFAGYENFWDTVAMIKNSYELQVYMGLYAIMCLVDCYFMIMIVTHYDSCVKMVTSTCAIFGCWALQAVAFMYSGGARGEMTDMMGTTWMLTGLVLTTSCVVMYGQLPGPEGTLPLDCKSEKSKFRDPTPRSYSSMNKTHKKDSDTSSLGSTPDKSDKNPEDTGTRASLL